MCKFINYIRSCFCKHQFELLNETKVYEENDLSIPIGKKWTYRCTKCCYHKIIKNY